MRTLSIFRQAKEVDTLSKYLIYMAQFVTESKRNSVHIVKFLRNSKKSKSLNYFSTEVKYYRYER